MTIHESPTRPTTWRPCCCCWCGRKLPGGAAYSAPGMTSWLACSRSCAETAALLLGRHFTTTQPAPAG